MRSLAGAGFSVVLLSTKLQTTLADVRDLDYTEAIARMNKQMLALEAAMNSFSRVSQLNLFNFLQG